MAIQFPIKHPYNAQCFCFLGSKTGPAGARLICPKCDMHVKKYELLDAHLSDAHNITIEEEYLEFGDEESTFKSNGSIFI